MISISLKFLALGISLLAISLFVKNIYIQYPLLFTSIVFSIIAVVKNIQEKKHKP